VLALLLFLGCEQKSSQSPRSSASSALPALGTEREKAGTTDEALYRIEPAAPWGDNLPHSLQPVYVEAASISIGKQTLDRTDSNWSRQALDLLRRSPCAVLLASDPERYLADLAPLLELLATAGCEVWVRHPDASVGFKVVLRDNAQFERWLAEPEPGKIRVIQRADGFELQTNIGKMPGSDSNGPTVPIRGGQLDIARLRRALERLKERFSKAPDSCLVPSYGTELPSIARALSGYYRAEGKRIFDQLCLVYPRAGQPPSDAGRR
jgi:hypothetical protein